MILHKIIEDIYVHYTMFFLINLMCNNCVSTLSWEMEQMVLHLDFPGVLCSL